MNETKMSLWNLLEQPPTVVIYRPDGQLSLDQLPGMNTPDAVVCFYSMKEARQFLGQTLCSVKRKRLKGFRPVQLTLDEWLGTMKAEAEKGRTHVAIFHLPGDNTVGKISYRIADIFNALDYANKVVEEDRQAKENWRWN
jgi:hypothetical protein